jgi:TusA-related sulfurtransferase
MTAVQRGELSIVAPGPIELMTSQAARKIDCRGQLCPKPILMTKRALAEAPMYQVLEIIVNEHLTKENVLKYCWNHGQEVFKSYEDGTDFHIFVKKSPEKKVDTPLPVIGPCGARWD